MTLQEENACLRERILQLEGLLMGPTWQRYMLLGLSRQRARLLSMLMQRVMVTSEQSIQMLGQGYSYNYVQSTLRWLRKDLPEIKITTLRAEGILLAPEEKVKVEAMLARFEGAKGAPKMVARKCHQVTSPNNVGSCAGRGRLFARGVVRVPS